MITALLIAAGVICVLIAAHLSDPVDEIPAATHRALCFGHLRQVWRCLAAGEIVFAGWWHAWQWLVDIMQG